MSFDTIIYQTDGPVATVTLNRPEKLNAINAAMVAELDTVLDQAEADDAVKVIVLAGAGRAFSAGFDLDMDSDEDQTDLPALRRELTDGFNIIMRFWDCPKPTIAAVHKYCLGSAMEMAVACDITITADDCRFGAPEVKFGSGMVALVLPWFIGPKRAKELLLTGDDKVTAEQALQYGLVNRVVAAADLRAETQALAEKISAKSARGIRSGKEAFYRQIDMPLEEAFAYANEAMLESMLSGEATEGTSAFLEKRAPRWGDA